MTFHRPSCTQISPTPYIQELVAMNVLIDDNRDNNYTEQQLQEYARTKKANVIIRQEKTKAELVQYLYGACLSPSQFIFVEAINIKHLLKWPGPDSNIVSNNLPTHVISTVKVQMKQEIQHLRPTKKHSPPHEINTEQE